jgi:hypothetical protein
MVFAVAGWQIVFLAGAQYHVQMKLLDIFTLPIMMNFWSFLIPARGAVLFLIMYLKFKYKIRIVEGTSMFIYIYAITVVLVGIFGFLHACFHNRFFSWQTLIAIGLMFNPLIFNALHRILKQCSFRKYRILQMLQDHTQAVMANVHQPWFSLRITGIIFGLTLLHLICRTLWYYWGFRSINISVDLPVLIPFTLMMELTRIIRISPGNLGFEELMTGGVYSLMGGDTAEGILLALFLRISALILTFSIGTWCVIMNMKYFDLDNFQSLWLKLKNEYNRNPPTKTNYEL